MTLAANRKKPSKVLPKIEVGLENDHLAIRWSSRVRSISRAFHKQNIRFYEFLDFNKALLPVLDIESVSSFLSSLEKKKLVSVCFTPELTNWLLARKLEVEQRQKAVEALSQPSTSLEHPSLKIPLLPWQVSGIRFLEIATQHGQGASVGDQLGLGKTYTVNGFLATNQIKAVVVCPAELRFDWQSKIEHLTDLSSIIINAGDPIFLPQWQEDLSQADIVIVSYHSLKKLGWVLYWLLKHENRALVLDEAHHLRNPERLRSKIVLALSQVARFTISVTFNLIVNRVGELYEQLRYLRRLWAPMSRKEFIRRYEGQEQVVSKYLTGVVCRRMAKDVWQDMPELVIADEWVKLSNRREYKEVESDFSTWLLKQGRNLTQMAQGQALRRLNKLRQLSASGKVEAFSQVLQQGVERGEKAVVFCSFTDPLFQLYDIFKDSELGAGVFCSKVSSKDRRCAKADFQAGKIGLLFCGIESGGQGFDFQIANYGYSLDLPWTSMAFDQATGRIARIGQTKKCLFRRVLARKTIDSRMLDIIAIKRQRAQLIEPETWSLGEETIKSYFSQTEEEEEV